VRKIIGGPNKRAWMVKLYAWDTNDLKGGSERR
jgi:hypothetical protein